MIFYIAGCLIGGAATGAIVGILGSAANVPSVSYETTPLLLVGTFASIGLLMDRRLVRWRLPTFRRQVNDEWLTKYRGWVYGLGFGVQLGSGLSTIVNSSSLYAAYLVGFLSGAPLLGGVIGSAFGLTRGLTQLPAGRVRTPVQIIQLDARLQRTEHAATDYLILSYSGIVAFIWVVAIADIVNGGS